MDVELDDVKYDFFRSAFQEVCDGDATDEEYDGNTCFPEWRARAKKMTDDAESLRYMSFNGAYEMQRNAGGDGGGLYETMNDRPIYVQRGRRGFDAFGESSPAGRFMYCDGAWVFHVPGVHKGRIDYEDNAATDLVDSCHWLMRSPGTAEYDLAKVPTTNWIVWTDDKLRVANDLQIVCAECEGPRNANRPDRPVVGCSYNGACDARQRCACRDGWVGPRCRTCACDVLTVQFGDATTRTYARVATTTTVYDRPAYSLTEIDSTPYEESDLWTANHTSDESQLLLYTGFEYVLLNLRFGDDDELSNYLRLFHSGWDYEYPERASYRSERTTSSTPTDLTWYSEETGEKSDFSLKCASNACARQS